VSAIYNFLKPSFYFIDRINYYQAVGVRTVVADWAGARTTKMLALSTATAFLWLVGAVPAGTVIRGGRTAAVVMMPVLPEVAAGTDATGQTAQVAIREAWVAGLLLRTGDWWFGVRLEGGMCCVCVCVRQLEFFFYLFLRWQSKTEFKMA